MCDRVHRVVPARTTIDPEDFAKRLVHIRRGGDHGRAFAKRAGAGFPIEGISPAHVLVSGTSALLELPESERRAHATRNRCAPERETRIPWRNARRRLEIAAAWQTAAWRRALRLRRVSSGRRPPSRWFDCDSTGPSRAGLPALRNTIDGPRRFHRTSGATT